MPSRYSEELRFNPVDRTGQLRDQLRPAVYVDASVLADFYSSQDDGFGLTEEERTAHLSSHARAVRSFVKSNPEKRLTVLADIRQLLSRQELSVHLVSSPLAELELGEVHARSVLRSLLVEAFGPGFQAGRKEMGRYLHAIFRDSPLRRKVDKRETDRLFFKKLAEELSRPSDDIEAIAAALADRERHEHPDVAAARTQSRFSHIFESKFPDCFVGSAWDEDVVIAPIVGFSLAALRQWGCLALMAAMQIGAADILHVLFAAHLGCKHFASFDHDFRLAREYLNQDFELNLICSPEELQSLVRAGAT